MVHLIQVPPKAYYIPNFISEEEEKYLLDQVRVYTTKAV